MIRSLQQARRTREVSIEEKTRRLLFRYWKQEEARLGRNLDPKDLLPIDVAATAKNVLSLRVVELWNVEGLSAPGERSTAIGWVDRNRRTIALDRELSSEVKRFTLAHEIGHLVTQPNIVFLQYRDDPRTDQVISDTKKPFRERQADFFAGFLTAPRKLLVDYYSRMFGESVDLAYIAENQAYALLGESGILSVLSKLSALELAVQIAARTSLVFGQPRTLAEIFGLSPTAVGVQLLRVGLVKDSRSGIGQSA